jgi:hypothetical protein
MQVTINVPDNGYTALTIDIVPEVYCSPPRRAGIPSASLNVNTPAPDNKIAGPPARAASATSATRRTIRWRRRPSRRSSTRRSLSGGGGGLPAAPVLRELDDGSGHDLGLAHRQPRELRAVDAAPGRRHGAVRDRVERDAGGEAPARRRPAPRLHDGRRLPVRQRRRRVDHADDAEPAAIDANGIGRIRPLDVSDSVLFVEGRQASSATCSRWPGGRRPRRLHRPRSHGLRRASLRRLHDRRLGLREDAELDRLRGALRRRAPGLTYLREHELWAWHRHDTDGAFERVCVVPEGDEDAVYVVVRRTINGADETVHRAVRLAVLHRPGRRVLRRLRPDVRWPERRRHDDDALDGGGWTTRICSRHGQRGHLRRDQRRRRGRLHGGRRHAHRDRDRAVRERHDREGPPAATIPADLQAVATTTWTLAVSKVAGLRSPRGRDARRARRRLRRGEPEQSRLRRSTSSPCERAGDALAAVRRDSRRAAVHRRPRDARSRLARPAIAQGQEDARHAGRRLRRGSRGIFAGSSSTVTDDAPTEGLEEKKGRESKITTARRAVHRVLRRRRAGAELGQQRRRPAAPGGSGAHDHSRRDDPRLSSEAPDGCALDARARRAGRREDRVNFSAPNGPPRSAAEQAGDAQASLLETNATLADNRRRTPAARPRGVEPRRARAPHPRGLAARRVRRAGRRSRRRRIRQRRDRQRPGAGRARSTARSRTTPRARRGASRRRPASYRSQAGYARSAGFNQARGYAAPELGTLLGGAGELADIWHSAPKGVSG